MKTKSKLSLLTDQKITYTFTSERLALAYIKTLVRANYVFTCLPYTDCVRIETYTAAPVPDRGIAA